MWFFFVVRGIAPNQSAARVRGVEGARLRWSLFSADRSGAKTESPSRY